MARLKTKPVTVVQGDDAPDIILTLQQDSSGTPYVLTNRNAYVVLVDTADPENYVAKFQAEIVDENLGTIKISWIKDPVTSSSYLDGLTPGKRYSVQVFIARTDLAPEYLEVTAFYDYFNGKYYNTGRFQEGSPIYKHEGQELFLSRSEYTAEANPDQRVWLITSRLEAIWEDVKLQDKNLLDSSDLTEIPLWNYRRVVLVDDEVQYPASSDFETSGDFVITPDVKQPITVTPTTVDVPQYKDEQMNVFYENPSSYSNPVPGAGRWAVSRFIQNPIGSGGTGQGGWTDDSTSQTPYEAPCIYFNPYWGTEPVSIEVNTTDTILRESFSLGEPPEAETRGTQTVLTQIPLIVKPAYRLANEG